MDVDYIACIPKQQSPRLLGGETNSNFGGRRTASFNYKGRCKGSTQTSTLKEPFPKTIIIIIIIPTGRMDQFKYGYMGF